MKTDFKKTIDTYTAPSGRFEVVTVPEMQFLMIDGHGDPNSFTTARDKSRWDWTLPFASNGAPTTTKHLCSTRCTTSSSPHNRCG